MTNDAFQNTLANDQRLIENALQQLLPPTVFDQGEVVEAMRYSLMNLSLIHISEPTRLLSISYAVFCLK